MQRKLTLFWFLSVVVVTEVIVRARGLIALSSTAQGSSLTLKLVRVTVTYHSNSSKVHVFYI